MYKKTLPWLFVGCLIFLLINYCTPSAAAPITPKEPVFIKSGDLEFPLEKMDGHDALPYESGPAFWFKNGYVIDIASHCGEFPGDRFKELQIGSVLEVTYNDGSNRNVTVYDNIEIRYESASQPYSADWVNQSNGISYSPMEFTTMLATQKGAYMFHSSLCTKEFSVGQRVVMAH